MAKKSMQSFFRASVQMKEGSEGSFFLRLPPGADIEMENKTVPLFFTERWS